MPMGWVALAGGVASLGGAALGANAAGRASDAQHKAAEEAIAEQRREFDINQGNLRPFITEGQQSISRLGDLLGVSGNSGATGYGDLARKFNASDLAADPVYNSGLQFGLDQGVNAINARNIANGTGFDSGATLKQLTRYANDYGTTKAEGAYNRFTNDQNNLYAKLSGQASTGLTGAGTAASTGVASTNAITNAIEDDANAQAAGIVGGANAWGGALSGIGNNLTSTMLLRQLLATGGGGGGGNGGTAPSGIDPSVLAG